MSGSWVCKVNINTIDINSVPGKKSNEGQAILLHFCWTRAEYYTIANVKFIGLLYIVLGAEKQRVLRNGLVWMLLDDTYNVWKGCHWNSLSAPGKTEKIEKINRQIFKKKSRGKNWKNREN